MILSASRPAAFRSSGLLPQAIYWRPLEYFCTRVGSAEDELDQYRYTRLDVPSEAMDVEFEMRRYRADAAHLTSLYLSGAVEHEAVRPVVLSIEKRLALPEHAAAWRRDDPFEFGRVDRDPDDRLNEPEAGLIVLKLVAANNGKATSRLDIVSALPRLFPLTGLDDGYPFDEAAQIVDAAIGQLRTAGLIALVRDELLITADGAAPLRSIGYL